MRRRSRRIRNKTRRMRITRVRMRGMKRTMTMKMRIRRMGNATKSNCSVIWKILLYFPFA